MGEPKILNRLYALICHSLFPLRARLFCISFWLLLYSIYAIVIRLIHSNARQTDSTVAAAAAASVVVVFLLKQCKVNLRTKYKLKW